LAGRGNARGEVLKYSNGVATVVPEFPVGGDPV